MIKSIANAKALYKKLATIVTPAFGVSFYLWSASQGFRIFGIGIDSFLMQHSSNFYIGALALGMIHSNLSSMSPEKRFKILSISSFFMASLNVLLELNVGLPQVPISDWADFYSGMSGIAAYWVVVSSVESFIKFNKKKYSR